MSASLGTPCRAALRESSASSRSLALAWELMRRRPPAATFRKEVILPLLGRTCDFAKQGGSPARITEAARARESTDTPRLALGLRSSATSRSGGRPDTHGTAARPAADWGAIWAAHVVAPGAPARPSTGRSRNRSASAGVPSLAPRSHRGSIVTLNHTREGSFRGVIAAHATPRHPRRG